LLEPQGGRPRHIEEVFYGRERFVTHFVVPRLI
jgi:hypothetical protein